jgi:hypothetical protein
MQQSFVPRLLAKTHIEAFVHGNVVADKALSIAREVVENLGSAPLLAEERSCDDVICIPFGASYLHRFELFSSELLTLGSLSAHIAS